MIESFEIKALGEQEELQNRGSRSVGEVEVLLITTDEKRYMKHWVHTVDLERASILEFFKKNINAFPWLATNMPPVDPEVIAHKLKLDLMAKPVRQMKRNIGSAKKVMHHRSRKTPRSWLYS